MEWFERVGGALGGWVAMATAVCVVTGSYLYTRFATRKQVEDVMDRVDAADHALARRLVDVERSIERLNIGLKATPTRAEYHEMRVEMEHLSGGMDVLGARLEGMTMVLAKLEKPLDLLVEHQMGLQK